MDGATHRLRTKYEFNLPELPGARTVRLFFLVTSLSACFAGEDKLTLVSASGEHQFNIELVDDDASRAQGLMFRTELADNAGMLFDFYEERPVSFWMRNTLIPLDMIFAKADGTIVNIIQMHVR